MGRIRRKFDLSFKQKIIQQVESGEISQSEAARKYQLSASLIQKWRQQIHEGELRDTPSKEMRLLQLENDRLKKKLAELVMDIELLKKLQAYARQKRSADTCVITSKNLTQFQEDARS
jgi:transposase-like protein